MTNWYPVHSKLSRPAYLSLADQIAEAIGNGTLPTGARLPPHRTLASNLKLSVQTVGRAYQELIRRRLIAGEVGRGSFVKLGKDLESAYLPDRVDEIINLSTLRPVCDGHHLEKMCEAFGWLADNLPPALALSCRPNVVSPRHQKAAAEWLALCGLDVLPINITVTNGATAAITTALMSAVLPGGVVAAESLSHHTLVPLSTYLGVQIEGVAIDHDGMIPGALEAVCKKNAVEAVFLQPTVANPRTLMMSAERREALASIARKYDLAIIEDDILGPLVENRPPPMASFAPERTLYITSFSKITVPSLRIGYLAAPTRFLAAVANRHLVSNWMATPSISEIAMKWVADGTARALVDWQRAALATRHAIVAKILSGFIFRSHPQSLHVWLPLGEDQWEENFVTQARLRGVAVAPGASSHVSDEQYPAVRISIGTTTETELLTGLKIISSLAGPNFEELLLAL
ncbi:transcriptional regulator/aminotransferase domain-containing protein (plasmid) [Rhizobium gallicum]|uniref:Transcriptional regulator/aminotransferase domain-containing protein n=1 Tax=Rhizobium gallicum TaxID=56730 RepID=A0A1L5NR33_9HYPH|nr:PLP-dependent aminotransferase family protein [Rhizobium gallicum]APO70370.1 transcriptional regulator/aminotransferase domain-containing protein [Rhizobium gallicum]